MANSYTKIYVQAIFATKYRNAELNPGWRKTLFGVIGKTINQEGCKTIAINGMHDHVHCFFILKPDIPISKIVQKMKSMSSKWVNDQNLTRNRFAWQSGYGAFTYGQSQVNDVINYIQNQEIHHKKKAFREEYLMFLEKFKVDYDETYVFKDSI